MSEQGGDDWRAAAGPAAEAAAERAAPAPALHEPDPVDQEAADAADFPGFDSPSERLPHAYARAMQQVEVPDWSAPCELGGAARAAAVIPSFTARVKTQLVRARTWVEQKEGVIALLWWCIIAACTPFVMLAGVNYRLNVVLWAFAGALLVASVAFYCMIVSKVYYRIGIALLIAVVPMGLFDLWGASWRDVWVYAVSYWAWFVVSIGICYFEARRFGPGVSLIVLAVLHILFLSIDYTIQWRFPRPSSERYEWVAVSALVLCLFFFAADEALQEVRPKGWRRPRVRLRLQRRRVEPEVQSVRGRGEGMVAYASGLLSADGTPIAVTESAVLPPSLRPAAREEAVPLLAEEVGSPGVDPERPPGSPRAPGAPFASPVPSPFKEKFPPILMHASVSCMGFAASWFTLSSSALTDGECTKGGGRTRALTWWAAGLLVVALLNFRQREPQWVCLLVVGAGVLSYELLTCIHQKDVAWGILSIAYFVLLIIVEIPTLIRIHRTLEGPIRLKQLGAVEGRTAVSYFLKSAARSIILIALLFIVTFGICELAFPIAGWLRDQEACPSVYSRADYDSFMSRLPPDIDKVPVLYPAGVTAETARFNESLIVGTHNSYHQKGWGAVLIPEWDYTHPPFVEQLERGYRELEIDIHWLRGIFHTYHVKLIDDKTSCRCFDTCLQMIHHWSTARNRNHDPVLIHVEFRGFSSNDLVCEQGSEIATTAMDKAQDNLETYFGQAVLRPRDVRCCNGQGADPDPRCLGQAETCADSMVEALETWGWPTIAWMKQRQKVFVFSLNLFGSNNKCRDIYYESDRYRGDSGILFDRALRDNINNARRSKTSAFVEGFEAWMDYARFGLVTRIRNTQGVESNRVIEQRYGAFPAQVLDYDQSPGSEAR
eukprot:TRINITY_DN60606_c0_g1_i1.p1 TRINITY_DN60606_c0_g1~~TRINITY_DN60606_c0_g1_i1.p1  ORF type:complete len:916 (+),score=304.77 TRINITY_DN60606_c0_g1_i1:85-2748(+)